MKLIDRKNDEISVSVTVQEFNFLREVLRELPQAIGKNELPTLTGYTHEQVKQLKAELRGIAGELDIDL